jgi:hypothetical protein
LDFRRNIVRAAAPVAAAASDSAQLALCIIVDAHKEKSAVERVGRGLRKK